MPKVSLDLAHLEYIQSLFPEKSASPIGEQAIKLIHEAINSSHRACECLEFDWFFNQKNDDRLLKDFIDLPMQIKMMNVTEFFGSFEERVYIRVINALKRRGCNSMNQLMDLSIYQISCTRNLGDRSQLAILRALQSLTEKEPS
ncbi:MULTISPECIES: DNA-directed RNA polymerase subunit alpha C-terminal domain-containing protein [Paenibacillus]|uniref:DNA-directed RNA polymerase subunit alpha C-terminal domain-containing protein n=1 Tax=Paenibacillus vandeheii TaxID=3035917 RepID=A0ABT8JFF0_9BACL|nr:MULTISPECIES: DNA-directed RNA polymerase subunit alpha C-terminal domain-containing protein [Paenibacillus]KGP81932.1 hypothetical protein P364_0113985 [Paenibacillus sp. MAEPY2]KGP87364.1 hypothetical protein P363_0112485 [Paenibacillus sp. MAEPY1]MDN4603845.1 DNA-directed RNA polymerase subunit alpha C-terminal domain-containing protein [Paenibacillus vandeheii]